MLIKELLELEAIFGFRVPVIFGGIDIVELDEMFDERDPDYDAIECTYKGKTNVSIKKYVQIKYGKRAVLLLKKNL